MIRTVLLATAAALVVAACATDFVASGPSAPAIPVQAQDSYYLSAHAAVEKRATERGAGRAKNVILFIGDGMGVSTITAARIYAGQAKGVDGESYRLAMEQLPYSAFSKTYTHDAQIADSAPTATAMTTGVKSWNGTLGVTQGIDPANCASRTGHGTTSLWELAEDAGLATGVISTARLTHATPAATYVETTERDWEDDTDVSPQGKAAGCTDIANDFVAWPHGDGFEVAMAGGRTKFLPSTAIDPEYPNQKGDRSDGRNLMNEWKGKGANRTVITDEAGFKSVNFDSDVQVLGLFEPSHMQYDADRNTTDKGEPSLKEMTLAGIKRLSRNPKGYIMMVEGGRIDHGHHDGNAFHALTDAVAFDEAIAAAVANTDPKDTLIIVTADHSHTFLIAGYAGRNNPILGLSRYPANGAPAMAQDGKPYTTLSYANGPGSICEKKEDGGDCARADLSSVDTTAKGFKQQSLVPLGSETHGGEDVAIFADGPGANLFSGTVEQNEIFHVMAKALRLVK